MKRKSKIMVVILIGLLLMGCRSSQKLMKEDTHSEETLSDSTREDSATQESRTESRETSLSEKAHATVRVTELSEPDSMGQQHPVRVTEIDYSRQCDTDINEKHKEEEETVTSKQSC